MAVNDVEIRVGLQDNVTVPLKTLESSIIRFAGAVSAAFAIVQTVAFPIREAAEFEQAMLSVAKTTNFSDIAIKGLSDDLLKMSTVLDVTAVELANIAAIAGQLGLGDQGAAGIAAFTETTARFSSVLDVTVETAAEGLAKISNIFNISLKEAEKISAAFNEVSNTSTASGQALIDIVRRLGNAGGTISLEQSLGLAATGVDFGLTLETIGTSFTKIFSNMQSRAGQFAEFMGTSTEEWAATVEGDGINALQQYLTKLNQVDSTTRAYTTRTLSGGGRIFALVNKLVNDAANGYKILGKNVTTASTAYELGTSSIEEHQRVLTGLIAQLKLLGNNITKLATEIGTLSLPFLKELAQDLVAFFQDPAVQDGFTQFAKGVAELGQELVAVIKYIANLNINWANLAQILKLLIEFKLAKYFLRVGVAIAGNIKALGLLTGSWALFGSTLGKSVGKQVAGVSGTLSRTLTGAGTASARAQKGFVAGWQRAVTQLDVINTRYAARTRRIYHDIAAGIQTTTVRMQAAGASAAAIQRTIDGRLAQQTTRLGNLRAARVAEIAVLKRTTDLTEKQAFAYRKSLGPIGLATGAIGKMGAAMKLAGGFLLRFITGPWGILVLLLGSSLGLFDKIGDAFTKLFGFLGFTTKSEQDLARAMRIATAEAAKQEEQVRSLASAYVELTKKQGNFKFPRASQFLEVNGAEGLDKLAGSIDTVIVGASARLDELRLDAEDSRKEIERLDEALTENVAKQQESASTTKLAQIDLDSVNTTTRQKAEATLAVEKSRLAVLKSQQQEMLRQRVELGKLVEDYNSGFDKTLSDSLKNNGIEATIGKEVRARQDELLQAQTALADGNSKVTQTGALVALAYRGAKGDVDKLTKSLEEARAVDETDDNASEREQRIRETQRQLTVAEGLLDKAAKDKKDFLVAATAGGSLADAKFGISVVDDARDLASATSSYIFLSKAINGAEKAESDLTLAQEQRLSRAQGVLKQNEDLTLQWKRAADQANLTKDVITASYKSIEKDLTRVVKPIKNLTAEIEQIKRQRLFDKNLEKDQKFITDVYDVGIERARKFKEAQIDAARASGNNRRADFLERDLARSTAFAEKQKEDFNTSKAAKAETKKLQDNIITLRKIKEESAQLLLQSQDESVRSDSTALAKIERQLAAKREEQLIINKELADSRRANAAGDFDITRQGVDQSAIGEGVYDDIFQQADELNGRIADSQRATITSLFKDVGKAVAPVLEGFEAISQENKDAQKSIEEVKNSLNLSEEAIKRSAAAWKDYGGSLSGVNRVLSSLSSADLEGAILDIPNSAVSRGGFELETHAREIGKQVHDIINESIGDAAKTAAENQVDVVANSDMLRWVTTANQKVEGLGAAGRINVEGNLTKLHVDEDTLDLGGVVKGGNAFATGGPVSGPGTGTSDSIPAWLSHGEYVIDAATTKFFGSGFFRAIQSAARGGVGLPMTALKALKARGFAQGGYVSMPSYKLGMPAFAGGGLVDALDPTLGRIADQLSAAQNVPPEVSERVELALSVGGGQYTVQGSRDQVKGLVEALKDVSRSVRRT